APEGRDHLRRPRERHSALGGRATSEDGDAHQWMPASWCRRSYRVTIPEILPFRRTSAAGVSRDRRDVRRASGQSPSTTGKGGSITSRTGRSSAAAPSSTGSWETLYVLIRFRAWRTVACGATWITSGPLPSFADSTLATVTRSESSIWFSRSHSSL